MKALLILTCSIIVYTVGCQKDEGPTSFESGGTRIIQGAFPSISPDGSKIAYSRGGQILINSINGNNETRLSSSQYGDYGPVWSADGNKIAFVRTMQGIITFYREGQTYSLVMAIDLQTNKIVTLEPFDTTANYFYQTQTSPIWCPTNDKVAYLNDSLEYGSLRIIQSDGSGLVLDDYASVVSFCWSPDGSQFICSLNPSGIYKGTVGQSNLVQISPRNNPYSLTWSSITNTIGYIIGQDSLIFLDVASQKETIIKHTFNLSSVRLSKM
jgi:Tol biopolymer transport system component